MPAILTSNISAMTAAQFVNTVLNNESNIYIGVATDARYTWENENVPPMPVDNYQEENKFRSTLIGIKRVNVSNIMLMMPRTQWAVGKSFETLSTTNITPKRATNYYCLTSNNYVYQCIGKSASDIITTIGGEPDLKLSEVNTIDGYTWKFLYNITPTMINNGMLLDSWMPVPYNRHGVYPGGTITEDQNSYGDKNANWTLGAFHVLISVTLGDEGDKIPSDTEFRRVGLLYDPLDNDGNYIAGDSYAKAEFDYRSGQVFYLENRRVVKRAEGQSEVLQVLLSF